jgi:hypothetical protein
MKVFPEENVFEAFHGQISFKAAVEKVTNKIQLVFINIHEKKRELNKVNLKWLNRLLKLSKIMNK